MSRRALPWIGLLAALAACAPAVLRLAGGPTGPAGAAAFIESLAGRFGPIEREPAFDALRPKLARAALVPSRVFDDASAWTSRGAAWRGVELHGFPDGGAYRIGVRSSVPAPSASGEYRSAIRLERLGGGRFEWDVREELHAGPLRPDDVAWALDALLRAAEVAEEAAARRAFVRDFPRTAAKLSPLVRVETLALARDGQGAASVRLALRLAPAGIRDVAPRYAAFLEKYAGPMRLSLALSDPGGATWWTLEGASLVWTLRLRVRDGSLVPLEGPADRRLPARLRATADYATRMGRFRVGARGIVADVTLARTSAGKALEARFPQEPDWTLPFLVETFLDDPLRFPFEGSGSELGWSLREAPGGLLLAGSYRSRVRETWILRWLGGMVGNAVSEFRRGAEEEADRYHRECLLALRDDAEELAAGRLSLRR